MGVSAYSEPNQAWAAPDTPQAFNAVTQAYGDSIGEAYDRMGQKWENVWGGKLYLYNRGNECIDVSGGWDRTYRVTSNGSLTKGPSSMTYIRNDYDGALVMQRSIFGGRK